MAISGCERVLLLYAQINNLVKMKDFAQYVQALAYVNVRAVGKRRPVFGLPGVYFVSGTPNFVRSLPQIRIVKTSLG